MLDDESVVLNYTAGFEMQLSKTPSRKSKSTPCSTAQLYNEPNNIFSNNFGFVYQVVYLIELDRGLSRIQAVRESFCLGTCEKQSCRRVYLDIPSP